MLKKEENILKWLYDHCSHLPSFYFLPLLFALPFCTLVLPADLLFCFSSLSLLSQSLCSLSPLLHSPWVSLFLLSTVFPFSPPPPIYRDRDSVELPSSWSIITTQLSLPLAPFLLAYLPDSLRLYTGYMHHCWAYVWQVCDRITNILNKQERIHDVCHHIF